MLQSLEKLPITGRADLIGQAVCADEFLIIDRCAYHYLMTAAAIGGRSCTARGRQYSAYENAIGTGSAHVVFERPQGGWTS